MERNYTNGEADCVMMWEYFEEMRQLKINFFILFFRLVCKLKPFIWNMQNVVVDKLKSMVDTPKKAKEETSKNSIDNVALFFEYLPSYEEYSNNGYDCENIYHQCKLF